MKPTATIPQRNDLTWVQSAKRATYGHEEVRNVLLKDYSVALKQYARATEDLSRKRATLSLEEYRELHRAMEDAREGCERLRDALAKLKR